MQKRELGANHVTKTLHSSDNSGCNFNSINCRIALPPSLHWQPYAGKTVTMLAETLLYVFKLQKQLCYAGKMVLAMISSRNASVCTCILAEYKKQK